MHLMHTAAQRITRRPGKGECILEKSHMRIKVTAMIALDSMLIKASFSSVTAEVSYFSGKRPETALLLKLHISRIQSGAHMSERADWEIVRQLTPFPAEDILPKNTAPSQLSCFQAKGVRWELLPQPPQYLICCCLPASKQSPLLSIFVGAGFQDLKLVLPDTGIPFMKATSCSATESWFRKAIYNTSALTLPLTGHWQVQLTPGQTYHPTFQRLWFQLL